MDGTQNISESKTLGSVRNLRVLHLSDSHIGLDKPGSRDAQQPVRIRGFVDDLLRDLGDKPVDLVVFTGDLSNYGEEWEYDRFFEWLFQPLSEAPNLKDALWCLVPGNHDVDFSADYADQNSITRYGGADLLQSSAAGVTARRNLLNRFTYFSALWNKMNPTGTRRTVCPAGWLADPGYFVGRYTLAGMDVRIIGLNTAWDEQRPKASASLYKRVGVDLLEKALDESGPSCAVTIVLGHHPLSVLDPGEMRAIQKKLGTAKAVYLHGHGHNPDADSRLNQDAVIVSLMTNAVDLGNRIREEKEGIYQGVGYSLIEFPAQADGFFFYPKRRERGGGFCLDDRLGAAFIPEKGGYLVRRPGTVKGISLMRIPWLPWTRSTSAPGAREWEEFAALGQPTSAVIGALPNDIAPVREACAYLTTMTSSPRIIWFDAPLGEGTDTVFLKTADVMCAGGWKAFLQEADNETISAVPSNIQIDRSTQVLLGLRCPRNRQEAGDIKRLLIDLEDAPHVAVMLRGNRWEWAAYEGILSQARVIRWGRADSTEVWVGSGGIGMMDLDWVRTYGYDRMPRNFPLWSLLGARAYQVLSGKSQVLNGDAADKMLTGAADRLGKRLRRHQELFAGGLGDKALGADISAVFAAIVAVHVTGRAILSRTVLRRTVFSGEADERGEARLERCLAALGDEVRCVRVKETDVILGRHIAVSTRHAWLIGGSWLARAFGAAAACEQARPGSVPFWPDWLLAAPDVPAFRALMQKRVEDWTPEALAAFLSRWREMDGAARLPNQYREMSLTLADTLVKQQQPEDALAWVYRALEGLNFPSNPRFCTDSGTRRDMGELLGQAEAVLEASQAAGRLSVEIRSAVDEAVRQVRNYLCSSFFVNMGGKGTMRSVNFLEAALRRLKQMLDASRP